ncbi:hypothetical protein [Stutzerimonas stutzeri]|uniref:hypothetical protein n=1 Tax=Stutzerimonas stutzeri TaxID=316 RepID=UPI0030B797A2
MTTQTSASLSIQAVPTGSLFEALAAFDEATEGYDVEFFTGEEHNEELLADESGW